MARPRAFDRDRALDRAMETFWSRGYERTSVQDLVDSMGIQRGSLYAAFGDKHHLFLEALDRYEARFHEDMVRLLRATPAREGIRRVFEKVLADCACDNPARGCMITNTAVALAEDDRETPPASGPTSSASRMRSPKRSRGPRRGASSPKAGVPELSHAS